MRKFKIGTEVVVNSKVDKDYKDYEGRKGKIIYYGAAGYYDVLFKGSAVPFLGRSWKDYGVSPNRAFASS